MTAQENLADLIYGWDDFDWVQVRPGVRAYAVPVDPRNFPGGAMGLAIDYGANQVVPPHYHSVGHLELVLSGTLWVTGRPEPAISLRVVAAGYEYGPIETRDNPCRVLEIFPEMKAENVTGKFDPEVLAAAGRTEADLWKTAARVGLV
jgi:hypothetical protein